MDPATKQVDDTSLGKSFEEDRRFLFCSWGWTIGGYFVFTAVGDWNIRM
jgi:hypothetical protein